MYNTDEAFKKAYKPYDIVSDQNGNVGFIQEVSINSGQVTPECQLSYAVNWLYGNNSKHAWFSHKELTVHCNLFVKIAEISTHPMGHNACDVKRLLNKPTN